MDAVFAPFRFSTEPLADLQLRLSFARLALFAPTTAAAYAGARTMQPDRTPKHH
jgi:hypothetical protein